MNESSVAVTAFRIFMSVVFGCVFAWAVIGVFEPVPSDIGRDIGYAVVEQGVQS